MNASFFSFALSLAFVAFFSSCQKEYVQPAEKTSTIENAARIKAEARPYTQDQATQAVQPSSEAASIQDQQPVIKGDSELFIMKEKDGHDQYSTNKIRNSHTVFEQEKINPIRSTDHTVRPDFIKEPMPSKL